MIPKSRFPKIGTGALGFLSPQSIPALFPPVSLLVILLAWEAFCFVPPAWSVPDPSLSPDLVKPSAEQIRFSDWELGAFFHFTISTYSGEAHGLGRISPKLFNPDRLDTRQWIDAARALGAKYAILTARHEDGFCLWPTKTTDYCVRSSPWKSGKGDVVREFVDACRDAGIEPCLYFSPGFDAHHAFRINENPKWGEWNPHERMTQAEFDECVRRDIAQVTELIGNYHPRYLWFDHNLGPGRTGELQVEVTKAARKADPHCLILGPDVVTTGNESAEVTYPMWNAVNTKDGTPYSRSAATVRSGGGLGEFGLIETDAATGNPFGKYWRCRDCVTDSVFGTHRWFWNCLWDERTNPSALDGEANVNKYYYQSVGLGANLTINFSPDDRGLVPQREMAGAKAFGDSLRAQFAPERIVAATRRVQSGDTVELLWEKPRMIDRAVLMENIANGQKIAAYTLEVRADGTWREVEPLNATAFGGKCAAGFETIGHKKIDRFRAVEATGIRFRCLKAVARPVEIRSMAVYEPAATPATPR